VEVAHVGAALVSAVLHAGWNAAVKASPRPRDAMMAQMVVSAALVVPLALWTGLPARAALPWIAGSTVLNVATIAGLLRAYECFGFGLAYPVVRALSVLVVVPLAAAVAGEALSAAGLLGVGLVAASLLLLAVGHAVEGRGRRAALGWILFAGVATAAYVLCDAQGARRAGSPWAYGSAVSVTNALAMCATRLSGARAWRALGAHAASAVPIALASATSYLLILWVWSEAPIAAGVALRDTSAVFAILIAIVWLREPFTRLRLAAMLLAAAAVPLLRFA
jgi:hypothetical protein